MKLTVVMCLLCVWCEGISGFINFRDMMKGNMNMMQDMMGQMGSMMGGMNIGLKGGSEHINNMMENFPLGTMTGQNMKNNVIAVEKQKEDTKVNYNRKYKSTNRTGNNPVRSDWKNRVVTAKRVANHNGTARKVPYHKGNYNRTSVMNMRTNRGRNSRGKTNRKTHANKKLDSLKRYVKHMHKRLLRYAADPQIFPDSQLQAIWKETTSELITQLTGLLKTSEEMHNAENNKADNEVAGISSQCYGNLTRIRHRPESNGICEEIQRPMMLKLEPSWDGARNVCLVQVTVATSNMDDMDLIRKGMQMQADKQRCQFTTSRTQQDTGRSVLDFYCHGTIAGKIQFRARRNLNMQVCDVTVYGL